MNQDTQHLNPEGLLVNPAFSQVVTTQGNGKTIYIGGQNAVSADHQIIGKDHIEAQTEQVLRNLVTALEAAGAAYEHVVKLNIYIRLGQNTYTAFQASQQFLGQIANPPVITVLVVAGFAHPDFLVEIDAIAFVPETK